MAPAGRAAVLSALTPPCYFACFFALFATCFVHNVAADRNKLLDIRTGITHLKLDEEFFLNESNARYILHAPAPAPIPVSR